MIVNEFQGLYAKADALVENPALAVDCRNILFYEGNICNLPYSKKIVNIVNNRSILCGQYLNPNGEKQIVLFYENKFNLCSFKDLVVTLGISNLNQWLSSLFDSDFKDIDINNLLPGLIEYSKLGNINQVGDTFIINSLFGHISKDLELPYMVKFRRFILDRVHWGIISPLGFKPPSRVVASTISGGSNPIGTGVNQFQFAITFIYGKLETTESTFLDIGAIESNAYITNEVIFSSGLRTARFEISLPKGMPSWLTNLSGVNTFNATGIGIYVRPTGATNFSQVYRLYKYISNVQGYALAIDPNGNKRFIIDFSEDIVTNLVDKNAPLTDVTPIIGAHDVPKPAFHSIYFKNRMYYATYNRATNLPETDRQLNLIQASATPIVDDPDPVRHINYIEYQMPIGKHTENATGFLEYLGQLIIFKLTETYILPDDISVGPPRILFPNKGCVNIEGGRGYININNTIFWASQDDICKWNGGLEPIVISDPIKIFLDKYKKMGIYKYVRFFHDERYNQLYITFPQIQIGIQSENIFGFAYNYIENKWSLIDNDKQIYFSINSEVNDYQYIYVTKDNVNTKFKGIGPVDEDSELNEQVEWFWKSSRLTLNRQSKFKHWGFLKLITKANLKAIGRSMLDKLRFIISTNDPQSESSEFELDGSYGECHLGLHSKDIQFEMRQLTDKAFRIAGYDLDAHIEDRR